MKLATSRKRLMRDYGKLYHRMGNVPLELCWYCNHTRQTLDHCPPISCLETLDIEKFTADGGKFLLIPSCSDCNHYLNAARLGFPYERLLYLERRYTKLTDKHFVNWTKEEIAELGYNLKDMIYAKDRLMRDLIRKLHCIQHNALKVPID